MAAQRVGPRRRAAAAGAVRRAARARPAKRLSPAENRRLAILTVRWGLAAISLGMLLTGEGSANLVILGLAAGITLAASNVALAQADHEMLDSLALSIAIALADALLIVTVWYSSGYESFAPVILSLCLVNLALVGVSLTEIAAVAVAAVVVYLVIGQAD